MIFLLLQQKWKSSYPVNINILNRICYSIPKYLWYSRCPNQHFRLNHYALSAAFHLSIIEDKENKNFKLFWSCRYRVTNLSTHGEQFFSEQRWIRLLPSSKLKFGFYSSRFNKSSFTRSYKQIWVLQTKLITMKTRSIFCSIKTVFSYSSMFKWMSL
jgi:hypothetical protein